MTCSKIDQRERVTLIFRTCHFRLRVVVIVRAANNKLIFPAGRIDFHRHCLGVGNRSVESAGACMRMCILCMYGGARVIGAVETHTINL